MAQPTVQVESAAGSAVGRSRIAAAERILKMVDRNPAGDHNPVVHRNPVVDRN